MTIDWSKYFDGIYCIHYLPYKDRVERMTSELKRVGILDSDVFHWKYTFDSPFYENLINSDIKLFHDTLKRPNLIKCTLAHYSIYKEAQGLGLNRILVIEDDIVFLREIEKIKESLDNIPNGQNVIMFDYLPNSSETYIDCFLNRRINSHYCGFETNMWSGGFYSLDGKAIDFVIRRQENGLHAGDQSWQKECIEPDGLNRCFCIKNLGYQKQYRNSYTIKHSGNGVVEMFYSFCKLNTMDYQY